MVVLSGLLGCCWKKNKTNGIGTKYLAFRRGFTRNATASNQASTVARAKEFKLFSPCTDVDRVSFFVETLIQRPKWVA